MHKARTILLALLFGVGLIVVPASSAEAVNTGLYSYRACREYNYWIGLGTPHVCVKTYASRQADGTGWRVNSIHVYAWTESQGAGCGTAIDGTSLAGAAIDNDNNTDGVTWHRDAPLSPGNDCDRIWRGDPLVRIGTRSVEMTYTYHLQINGRPDPSGRDQVRVYLSPNGNDLSFSCSGDTCNMDGPF